MNPLSEYWASIRDGGWPAVVLHITVPAAFGAIALAPGGVPAYTSQIVTIVAIVAGLLFSMLVLLIDLRGKIRRGEDKRATPGDRDTANLDYAFEASTYTIIVGFVLAGLLLIHQQFSTALDAAILAESLPACTDVAINWLLYGLAAHFAAATMHCLRRLHRCYIVFGIGNR